VPPRPAPPRYAPNPRPSSTAEPVPPAAVSASSPPSSSSASVSGLPTPTPQRLGPRDASAGAPPSGICFQATTPGQRPSHSNSRCVWQFKPCAEAGAGRSRGCGRHGGVHRVLRGDLPSWCVPFLVLDGRFSPVLCFH
jgi:hypothetical protein